MWKQSPSERVAVFIDYRNVESNMYSSLGLTRGSVWVDYEDLVDQLVGDRTLTGAFIFDGVLRGYENKDARLHSKFKLAGFTVMTTLNSIHDNGQKGVDVNLALNMFKMANTNSYDTAIIVSNDKDFAPAVQMVRELGKKVEGAGYNSHSGDYLVSECVTWTNLEDLSLITKNPYYNYEVEGEIEDSNIEEEMDVTTVD